MPSRTGLDQAGMIALERLGGRVDAVQKGEQVGHVALGQLFLQALGHERLTGGRHLLDVAAQNDVLLAFLATSRVTPSAVSLATRPVIRRPSFVATVKLA